jgi:hypothetical protein
MLQPFFHAPRWAVLLSSSSRPVDTGAFISRRLIRAEPPRDIRFFNSGFCALDLGWYVAKESKFCFGADSSLISTNCAIELLK